MADGSATYSVLEKRWVYAFLTAPVLLTLVSATFTLKAPNGIVVSSINTVPATLVTPGPAKTVSVGYKVDCTTLSPGTYSGVFLLTDSTGTVWDVTIDVNVVSASSV